MSVLMLILTIFVAIAGAALLYWLLTLILDALNSPDQFRKIALVAAIVVLVFALWAVFFGFDGPPWRIHFG